MIRAVNLAFRFGNQIIYNTSNFYIGKDQKVGLVGNNGTGKSTLFRLLCGKYSPDEGYLEVDTPVHYVPQEVKKDDNMEGFATVHSYLVAQSEIPDYEIKSMLAGLELQSIDLGGPIAPLSGGQKTKLAIARALLQRPEILLLDEPTNFLDKAGKSWLFSKLTEYPHTLIVVSHDLRFLNSVIDSVLYINHQNKVGEQYKGNYESFLQQKKEREELLTRQVHVQQRKIERMTESLTKIGGRTEKGARRRIQMERRIEHLKETLPDLPKEARAIKVTLPPLSWVGELPMFTKNICKSFGTKQVLSGVNLTLRRGERTALLGPNGAGKTTLIKIMLGSLAPDSGEVIRDRQLSIGYYSQEFEDFNHDKTVIEVVHEKTHLPESAIRPLLFKMLFTLEKMHQSVGTLSGGEKTRLSIATLLLQPKNLLILDEPTTYLDVMSQRLILEALKEYQGSILIVSHNPEFIDGLSVHQKYYLPENKLELVSHRLQ